MTSPQVLQVGIFCVGTGPPNKLSIMTTKLNFNQERKMKERKWEEGERQTDRET